MIDAIQENSRGPYIYNVLCTIAANGSKTYSILNTP